MPSSLLSTQPEATCIRMQLMALLLDAVLHAPADAPSTVLTIPTLLSTYVNVHAALLCHRQLCIIYAVQRLARGRDPDPELFL